MSRFLLFPPTALVALLCIGASAAEPSVKDIEHQAERTAPGHYVFLGEHVFLDEAKAAARKHSESSILDTDRFGNLTPGFYAVAIGPFPSEGEAHSALERIRATGSDGSVEETGSVVPEGTRRRPVRLPREAAELVRRACSETTREARWSGDRERTEPAGKPRSVAVELLEVDPTARSLTLVDGDRRTVVPGHHTPGPAVWSADGRGFFLVEMDEYAGSGTIKLLALDTGERRYAQWRMADLAPALAPHPSKMDLYRFDQLCWLPDLRGVAVHASAAYRCSSGHPGIDQQWAAELGEDHCREGTKDLGTIVLPLRGSSGIP